MSGIKGKMGIYKRKSGLKRKPLSEEIKRKIGSSNSIALKKYYKIHPGTTKGKKFPYNPRPKAIGRIVWNKNLKGYKSGENHYNWKKGKGNKK